MRRQRLHKHLIKSYYTTRKTSYCGECKNCRYMSPIAAGAKTAAILCRWGLPLVWRRLIKLYQENGCGIKGMQLPIFGGELSPQNMVRGKGGGVQKCLGGLMDVAFGEAFMKGGRVSLSICLLQRVKAPVSASGMIDGLGTTP